MAILTQLIGVDALRKLNPSDLEILESTLMHQLITNAQISEQLAGPIKGRYAEILGADTGKRSAS